MLGENLAGAKMSGRGRCKQKRLGRPRLQSGLAADSFRANQRNPSRHERKGSRPNPSIAWPRRLSLGAVQRKSGVRKEEGLIGGKGGEA